MKSFAGILLRAFCIVCVSTVLGSAVNAFRPGGPPLLHAETSVVQPGEGGGDISIQDAALLFLSQRAVFLDARSSFEYQQGHIQGAVSFPVEEFHSYLDAVKPLLEEPELVITYCDGESCPLGRVLAQHLMANGVTNVRVLMNGLTLWNREQLPVEQGPGREQ